MDGVASQNNSGVLQQLQRHGGAVEWRSGLLQVELCMDPFKNKQKNITGPLELQTW